MNGRLGRWVLAVLSIAAAAALAPGASACPGCPQTGATFSDEIAEMDVVVVARLIEAAPLTGVKGEQAEFRPSKFEIARVLKGNTIVRAGDKLETLYFGSGKPGSLFLVMGIAPPKLMWSTPLHVTERGIEYLAQLMKLPKDGLERYQFVLKYLEDEETDLSRDAYDEFAKAPYATVLALKDHLQRDQLIARIKDPGIPATRRRLYFVMLGVVGGEKDLVLLDELMQSPDREQRRGLDMIIFCYLSIRGESGLATIEERFLRNKDCDYADTHAAIMALRFHAAERVTLQPQQAATAMRAVLERPDLADLVIPDLARWEDWGVMDKLMELFKSSDEKTSWVRLPVINYLRACPLPRAKELIAECETIDPQSVKRANAFFPSATPPAPEKASRIEIPGRNRPRFVSTAADAVPAAFDAPIPEPEPETTANSPAEKPSGDTASADDARATPVASINPGAAPAKALRSAATVRPNLWLLLGVPILAGAALWFLQSSILRGRIGRG